MVALSISVEGMFGLTWPSHYSMGVKNGVAGNTAHHAKMHYRALPGKVQV
jgi:hypothetical protein